MLLQMALFHSLRLSSIPLCCVCVCVCVCERVCVGGIPYIFLIYSSISGHLGCCHALAIVNSAALNIRCMYLFDCSFVQLYAQEWDC